MSFSAAQLQRFAQKTAAHRASVFGTAVTYSADGRTYTAALSGVRSSRELDSPEPGGFLAQVDFIARIARAAYPSFTPEKGRLLTVKASGAAYRIAEVIDNPRAPEWRLGLVAQHV